MVTDNRITPEWVETLAENEIFVFGCHNSGRHFDGASNFAAGRKWGIFPGTLAPAWGISRKYFGNACSCAGRI